MKNNRGYIAMGTIPDFREGWAIVPFIEKPHYWQTDRAFPVQGSTAQLYRSACGLWAALLNTQKPIVSGNAPKCKRCQQSVEDGERE